MSKIFHNVIKPFAATVIGQSTTDSTTCKWLDISGWTDKVVTVECDDEGGAVDIDIDINMLVSSKDAYTLNNETTVDTEDYVSVTIVEAHTTAVYTRFDSDDVADLRQPIRSCKFTIDNDDATDDVTVNLTIEGWS